MKKKQGQYEQFNNSQCGDKIYVQIFNMEINRGRLLQQPLNCMQNLKDCLRLTGQI